ncbi:MAG: nucleotide exchange factor GrpE [Clostridiales bacterium]|nr:nucleotide exchange factor GrpE [Clostridiales bacterium]
MEEHTYDFDESRVEEAACEASAEEGISPQAGAQPEGCQSEDASSQEGQSEEAQPEEGSDSGEAADGEEKDVEGAKGKDRKKKKKSSRALEMELEKSQEKVADITDRYQRLMAEFENARKRNAKEQSRMYDVGAREVLTKLLPVVDNFERGLDGLTDEEKEGAFAQGVEKIYQQLMTVFDEIGVKAIDAAGKEFDPNYHNAVMHVEDEDMGENLVAEEFQKGYMHKDTVLRHSMVKVVN